MARTGSNLLVDGLTATGCAGRPNQFFLEKYEQKFAEKHGVPARPFEAYVRGLVRNASSSNAVFGFKLMSWYLDDFLARVRGSFGKADAADAEILRRAFPQLQFVQIVRENKLRQAISKARALQTGVWKIKGESRTAAADFGLELIDECLRDIERDERTWSQFFKRNGLSSLQLHYERLCSDYDGTIRSVFDFLKIKLPHNLQIGAPVTIRQGDEVSADWERRYLSLTSASPAAAPL